MTRTAVSPSIEVHLLGKPRAQLHSGSTIALERKDAALLAMIALDGGLPRAQAAAMLWPDAAPLQAGRNLRQRLFRLRHGLGLELFMSGTTLNFRPEVEVDLPSMTQRLMDDPDACQGPLLGLFDYGDADTLDDWVRSARQRVDARRRDFLAQRAAELQKQQRLASALRYAERLAADEPLLEHAHRRVMELHYLRGDRAAALSAFERCRAALWRELGLTPAEETRRLVATIDRSRPPTTAVPAPRPVSILRPPVLVGRESAWRDLTRMQQSGATVLLVGEPGVGKTRLAAEFALTCAPALTCGARPGDAQLPYALLARLARAAVALVGPPIETWVAGELARIVPELGVAVAGPLDPLRLKHALATLLGSLPAAGVRLAVVDDLHFSDAASLDVLPALLGSEQPSRLAWILASRAAELPPALQPWLDRTLGFTVHRLHLTPLDTLGVETLLESLAVEQLDGNAWAEPLWRHTSGNPLFVIETLIALLDADLGTALRQPAALPLPRNVGVLIERRLKQLSPRALQVAHAAAIAGQDFSADLACRVLGLRPLDLSAAWTELEEAQIIRDASFAHDLIHEATLCAVPSAIAALVHRDVALDLEAQDGEPSRVAHHWRAAGDGHRAGQAFLRAAAQARRRSERRLEVELADAAAEALRTADKPADAFDARTVALKASRHVESLDLQSRRATRLLELAESPAQRSVALEALATVLVEDCRDEELDAVAGEARALARAAGDAARDLAAARLQARALSRMGQRERALNLVHEYAAIAYLHDDEVLAAHALGDFACALIACDRTEEAQSMLARAFEIARQHEDYGLLQFLHGHQAWADIYSGDLLAAIASFEAGRALAPRLGSERQPAGLTDAILARHYKELGQFARALSVIETSLAEQRENPGFGMLPICDAELSDIYLWLGQPAKALAALGDIDRPAHVPAQRALRVQAARIARWEGHDARAWIAQAMSLSECEGGIVYRLWVELEQVRVLDAPQALALARDAVARCDAVGLAQMAWPMRVHLADTMRRYGDIAQAARLAARVAERFDQKPPTVIYPPEMWWLCARALASNGSAAAAQAALDRAVRWIRDAAAHHVPEPFRAGFLQRNPVNVQVLEAARSGRPIA